LRRARPRRTPDVISLVREYSGQKTALQYTVPQSQTQVLTEKGQWEAMGGFPRRFFDV
jgi:hypothetical protein